MRKLGKHWMRSFTALAAAGLLLTSGLASTAMAEASLNVVTMTPKKASIAIAFKRFIDAINQEFKGELKLRWRGGPEVVPPFKQPDAVRNGSMDMTITSPSYYSGLVASASATNLSFKTYNEIKQTGYYDRMTEIHAEKGLVFLGEIPATAIQFHIMLRDKIDGIEGISGKKIRVFPTVLPMVKAMGGSPLVLPMGEIYTAMERGMIDGFVQGKTYGAKRFQGMVHYILKPGAYRAGFHVLVNPAAWNKLSPGLRGRVLDYFRNTLAPQIDSEWTDFLAKADDEITAAGVKDITLTGADADHFRKLVLDAAWATLNSKAPDVGPELQAMLVD